MRRALFCVSLFWLTVGYVCVASGLITGEKIKGILSPLISPQPSIQETNAPSTPQGQYSRMKVQYYGENGGITSTHHLLVSNPKDPL